MPPYSTADHSLLEVIIRSPGTMIDDVVFQCHNLTWNQVFTAIDRLNREGVVTLTPKGGGHYSVQVLAQASQGALAVMALLVLCPSTFTQVRFSTTKETDDESPYPKEAGKAYTSCSPGKSNSGASIDRGSSTEEAADLR